MYKLLHIPSGVYCEKCTLINNVLYIFNTAAMDKHEEDFIFNGMWLWLDLDSNKWHDLILATLKSINPLTVNFITQNYVLNAIERIFNIDISEFELIKDD